MPDTSRTFYRVDMNADPPAMTERTLPVDDAFVRAVTGDHRFGLVASEAWALAVAYQTARVADKRQELAEAEALLAALAEAATG